MNDIENYKQLANFLRCQEEFLDKFFKNGPLVYERHKSLELVFAEKDPHLSIVEIFYIPKRNKLLGYRKVHAVKTDNLRSILVVLNNSLTVTYQSLDCIHGFIPRRNIRTNGMAHLAKKFVLSVDIKDFFESITSEQVYEALRQIGFSEFSSIALSKLVTLKGTLVQGYNTSPLLSNLVVRSMDEQLLGLCGNDTNYTRYADDLYFSTNNLLPPLNKIRQIIESNGFKLNNKKTKRMNRGSAQYVTGLTVFDSKMPRIPKRFKRRIRLELYYIKRFVYLAHALRKLSHSFKQYVDSKEVRKQVNEEVLKTQMRLWGWILFIGSVEKETSKRLMSDYKKCR